MSTVGNVFAMKTFSFGSGKTWAATDTVTAVEQSVSAPGVKTTDLILVQKPAHQSGLSYNPMARCDADGTIKILFINPTAGNLTATAEESWSGVILRSEQPLIADNATI